MSKTTHPLWNTYSSMIGRCYRAGPAAKNYRDKGIVVCDRWREPKGKGFANFVADMGPKPTPSHTVERKESDGPYSPDNCKWATRREQMLNTSRTVFLMIEGVRYRRADLAEQYGVSPSAIKRRAEAGLSFAEVVSRHHLAPGYSHMSEMIAKSARINLAKTHCGNGHEMTPENTRYRKEGHRVCKRCALEAAWRHRGKPFVSHGAQQVSHELSLGASN